ncbi:MAG: hypothetical protein PHF99_12025 [Bacteroidales bacterium]|jgi:hypothetical protein|nr:hypothetical protein [Bacteroidales bacterium]
MKKSIIIATLSIIFSTAIIAQTTSSKNIIDMGVNFGYVTTSEIDNYFIDKFDNYKNSCVLITGVTISDYFLNNKKFALGFDFGINTGTSITEFKEEQYKKLDLYVVGLVGEYRFFEIENINLTVKTGIYYELYNFLYTNKSPYSIVSYSNINTSVPLNFCVGFPLKNNHNNYIGIFIQNNIKIDSGKLKHTGIDLYADADIKSISMNTIILGIKYRF